MIEHIREILEGATAFIEVFAVAVIVVGFVRATIKYPQVLRAEDREVAFHAFRGRFGMDLLLGLEILVVADVIESIILDASYASLMALAFLVVIRTAVSWSTSLQVEGRWPWQAEQRETMPDA
ncbi:hypothetical protein LP7551_04939 [Roseibium album]|nr:hypothetical protein LP7551_04939 [Roseibium album]